MVDFVKLCSFLISNKHRWHCELALITCLTVIPDIYTNDNIHTTVYSNHWILLWKMFTENYLLLYIYDQHKCTNRQMFTEWILMKWFSRRTESKNIYSITVVHNKIHGSVVYGPKITISQH